MFDIGWSELVVIGVVALIAIGPKELPGVLRAIGQWTGKIRRMAGEFQGQFQEAMREAEMADVKKQVDAMTSSVTDTVKDYTHFDPLGDARKEIDDALAGKPTTTPGTDAPVATQVPPIDVPLPEQLPTPTEHDIAAASPAAESAATDTNTGSVKSAS
jgi:sec-independent protein translocase protein TatB